MSMLTVIDFNGPVWKLLDESRRHPGLLRSAGLRAGRCELRGLVSQASAAETQEQHCERVTFLAQLVETLEHLHLTTVNQARPP